MAVDLAGPGAQGPPAGRTRFRVVLVVILLLTTILILLGLVCVTYLMAANDYPSHDQPLALTSVHEWGILRQENSMSALNATGGPTPGSRPMPDVQVHAKKPVITFHGSGIGPVRVNVTINGTASDIVTIPPATVSGNLIQWNVRVAGPVYAYPTDDAYPVTQDGKVSSCLFYEASCAMAPDVEASVNISGGNVTFSLANISPHAVATPVFWCRHDGTLYLGRLERLDAGQNATCEGIAFGTTNETLVQYLQWIAWGLSAAERDSMSSFWVSGIKDENGLQASELVFGTDAGLVYAIPQAEYDAMFPLSIEPAPPAIERLGIVWVSGIPVVP